MLSWSRCGLGLLCFDLGELEAARVHVEESLKLSRKGGEKPEEGKSMVALGRIIGKADPSQSARAEGLILDGIKMLEELGHKPFQAEGYLRLGEFYPDAGRKQDALQALNKAKRMFQEMGMEYWLAKADRALKKLEG